MKTRIFKSIVVFVCSLFAVTLLNGQVTNGLVAHYPLDGNAQDVSGNNNHGTIQGDITPCEDRFGNSNSAFSFDRVNDYVQLDLINGENQININDGALTTVAFWT